ncbi:MAG: hypothetical protein ACRD0N_12180 [Acidimicrobiales bacterium]
MGAPSQRIGAAEAGLWRQHGERSPAHRLARLSGSGLGRARQALATAEAMDQLPRQPG